MSSEGIVYVVDDDAGMRKSLQRLLEQINLNVEVCSSAQGFLDAYDPGQPGCLVLDVRMPGTSGVDLHKQLVASGSTIPVIIITGHGDVAMAVETLKRGALDFFEKPFRSQPLLDRIQQALDLDIQRRRIRAKLQATKSRFAQLTAREEEIVRLLVSGKANKQIAVHFGVSVQAIDASRRKAMAKLRVENIVELVLLVKEMDANESQLRSGHNMMDAEEVSLETSEAASDSSA